MNELNQMDAAIRRVAREIGQRAARAHTVTRRGTVTAVSGGEVVLTVPSATGGGAGALKGRWVGPIPPGVGDVVTYLDEGRGYPLVFGVTGRDSLSQMLHWTGYTPSWTAAGANPAVGSDGVLSGQYLVGPQWCEVEIHLRAGTQTSWGSGQFFFGLPVAASTAVDYQELQGTVLDNGVRFYPAKVIVPGGTAVAWVYYEMTAASGASAPIILESVTGTTPFTFGVADMIHLHGRYRTA